MLEQLFPLQMLVMDLNVAPHSKLLDVPLDVMLAVRLGCNTPLLALELVPLLVQELDPRFDFQLSGIRIYIQ